VYDGRVSPERPGDELPVFVLEDDAVVRREIVARINAEPGFTVVADGGDLASARRALKRAAPRIALFDLRVPDGNAVSLIPAARAAGIEVLVLTVSDDRDDVYQALAAGAGGYLLKADALSTVGEALCVLRDGGAPISPRIARRVLDHFRDGVPARAAPASPDLDAAPETVELSPREREVIELFSGGATYGEVARALGMSLNTVRQHVRNLYDKLHVSSKTEAVLRAMSLEARARE
jgi:DNA-binding NarL/FixJ family response regulator